MTRWRSKLFSLLLIGIVIVFFLHPINGASPYKKTVLTVGYLTAIKGDLKDKQGLAISGALKMAIDQVNRIIYHASNDGSFNFPSLIVIR